MHVRLADVAAKMDHGKNFLFNRYLSYDEINHQDTFVFMCELFIELEESLESFNVSSQHQRLESASFSLHMRVYRLVFQ